METTANERKLIRRPEAAKLLGNMPISTLEKNKEIPAVRIGAAVYYDTADLWAWIESKKTSALAS